MKKTNSTDKNKSAMKKPGPVATLVKPDVSGKNKVAAKPASSVEPSLKESAQKLKTQSTAPQAQKKPLINQEKVQTVMGAQAPSPISAKAGTKLSQPGGQKAASAQDKVTPLVAKAPPLAQPAAASAQDKNLGKPMPPKIVAETPKPDAVPSATLVHKAPSAQDGNEFITDYDLYLLQEGTHLSAYEKLGAHLIERNGKKGAHFAVWAPNATRVSVVGGFNDWDGNRNVLEPLKESGIWAGFVEGVRQGELYKYELLDRNGNLLPLKTDPYSFYGERPPATASIVWRLPEEAHKKGHGIKQTRADAISIYEVHLGSWRRAEDNRFLTYKELSETLIPYVKNMGFTHIELMPTAEFPFDGSWGYQPVSLFAPTSRFGTPQDFHAFVESAHAQGLGVLVDWVPGHFPSDAHGLATFDGTHLYEHADEREGKHKDWNTLIYNYGRAEVANFLLSNAAFWMERYGIDGLRVDAVASMIYRNYSRKEGEWIANHLGGVENFEATGLLKRMNEAVYGRFPQAMTVAEESTAWEGVTKPTYAGGLGFGFKWNMGWMHDTLHYMEMDPIYRKYHHSQMTFGLLYGFSENFILPLSHDEVVYGKHSLLGRMPGDTWQKFANLRAYFGFMFTHPGKKLLFMGGEFAQVEEWNHDYSLDWHLLEQDAHKGVQSVIRDLNRLYTSTPALHVLDCEPQGFEWLESDAAETSVFAYLRKGTNEREIAVIVSNFTPVVRHEYRVGVPFPGFYEERFNSDAACYGGSNVGNSGGAYAQDHPHFGRPHSVTLTLPPLATIIFTLKE